MDFETFPKIPRLTRRVIVTEKIDGTNAQIGIERRELIFSSSAGSRPVAAIATVNMDDGVDYDIFAGSRSRWTTLEHDNYGFAHWVYDNAEELIKLGEGRHFGEWWGKGIQRNYGLDHKRFSLFNTGRWSNPETRPTCCRVVPVLSTGVGMDDRNAIEEALNRLRIEGSVAAPGFMKPEGVVVFHAHANLLFKKTLERDEEPKGAQSDG